jgi:Na+-driven multidrug efflux pump
MTILGITQGMQPIAGYNYGAKQYERVISVFKKSATVAVIIMTVGFLVGELFPAQIAGMFTKEQELIDISVVGMRFMFLACPIIGFSVVAQTLLQSIGRVKISIFLSLTRQALVLIPLIIVLPKYLGINGVWLGITLSDLVSFILTTFFMLRELKFLNNKILLNQ